MYGLKVFTSNGDIAIDDKFSSYAVVAEGNMANYPFTYINTGGSVSASFPFGNLSMVDGIMATISPDINEYYYEAVASRWPSMTVGIVYDYWTGYTASYPSFKKIGPSGHINYYNALYQVFVPTYKLSSTEQYGIKTFSQNGKVIFDSRLKHPRLIDILKVPINTIGIAGLTVSHVAAQTRPYYCIIDQRHYTTTINTATTFTGLNTTGGELTFQRTAANSIKLGWHSNYYGGGNTAFYEAVTAIKAYQNWSPQYLSSQYGNVLCIDRGLSGPSFTPTSSNVITIYVFDQSQ